MKGKSSFRLSACMIAVIASTQAVAQNATILEEIIVTAKQREQNLQEVPLPITVFSDADLIDRNILDSRDLALFTPNFNLQSGTGRGDPTAVAIRGVAPNTSDERFQGVNFFIDGVPLSGQISGIDLTQLERVEIIKGPQSAQFGRATYSGAVNYITKKPTPNTLEGNIRVRVGSTTDAIEDNHYLGARLSFPIVQDKFWGSFNVNQQRLGALSSNVTVPSLGIGKEETKSWGAVLYAKPTDNWDITLRVAKDDEDDSISASQKIHPREFTGTLNTINIAPGRTTILPSSLSNPNNAVVGGDPTSDIPGINPFDGGSERTRTLISLTSNFNFDSGYRLEYKGAFYEQDRAQSASFVGRDRRVDGSGNPVTNDPIFGPALAAGEIASFGPSFDHFEFAEDFENTSHQILLLSPGDQDLTWQVGAYYFEEDSDNMQGRFISATNPNGASRGTDRIENQSVFGSIAYSLTDQLSVSFEGRYQDEDVILEACTICPGGAFGGSLVDTSTENATDFLPRFTVDYQLSENNLLYGLYSKGVKSGRTSRVFVNGAGAAFFARPEELNNFEIGSKNVLFGGRATLNAAVFIADVKDQQLRSTTQIVVDGTPFTTTAASNVGNSDVFGFEIEGAYNITDNFSISGGIGFADQEFTGTTPIDGLATGVIRTLPDANIVTRDANGLADTVHFDGLSQANVPTTSGNLSAIYNRSVFDGMNMILRVDGTYRGEFYADSGNVTEVDDSLRFNFRATLDMENDTNTSVSFYARNLTDERDITSVGLGGATGTCDFRELDTATFGTDQRCLTAGILRPREVGLEITTNF